MIKKRFISMLVLLAAVATGAMAQTTYRVSLKGGTEDATYTLDGRRISKATQKGVYIQNGKKVVIK